ncbi:hypothetical protein [Helicobacter trogontum]|uniref:hypothetical protein n=1 Tax=Helicobacter trogontum TaxID=50960 RepID=UPI000CF02F5C|nr:hypothetical protein [Helicobacter trogontum]
MSRFLLITFCIFFSMFILVAHALATTKNNNLATYSNNLVCTIEQCKNGICIYICDINDIRFNRYIIESSELESAYATWLELTKMEYLLQTLPNENYEYTNEQTIIKYTWHNKDRLEITLHEKGNLVGNLNLYKSNQYIIIDDKLHSIINY